MHSSSKRFLIAFLVPIVLLMPFGIANAWFLYESGELTAVEDIVAQQRDRNVMYGTALHPNVYPYKMAIYELVRPDIVVIGSSRVLEFRQEQFTKPFVNLGRTINYPTEGEKLVDDMLAIHKPKMVLFGIDFWWSNLGYETAFNFATHDMRGGNLTPDGLLAPFKWLAEGKFSPDYYIKTLSSPDPQGRFAHIGVKARIRGVGFGPDGSNYYLSDIYGRFPAPSAHFGETLPRVENSTSQFIYGTTVSDERMASLVRILSKLKKADVPVVTFLPPIAPTVLQAMAEKGDKYAYVDAFRTQMATLSPHHYDFHDPRIVNSSDCEFVDGFHGGDVLMTRMLLSMAKDGNTGLSQFVDTANLQSIVSTYAGHATYDHRYRLNGEQEIDFLQIGCEKASR